MNCSRNYKKTIPLPPGLFCLLVCAFLHLTASTQQVSADSLRRQLATAREDTVRMRLLKRLGEFYIVRKYDTSIILYNQALVIARKNKLTGQESGLLTRLAAAFSFDPKKTDSARLYMQQALGLARQYKLPEQEIEWFQILSSVYLINWKPPDSAILLARQGIDLASKYKLPAKQLDLMGFLAYEYIQFKKPDSALQVMLDGILLARQDKLLDKETNLIAFVTFAITKFSIDTARILSQKAFDWARKLHEKKYEGLFLKGIAKKYFDQANYPEALKDFLQSLEIFEDLGDMEGIASVLDFIGQVYQSQGEYRKSLTYYLKSVVIQEKIQYPELMYIYERIGNDYAKLKMPDSATYFAKKSYELAARVGSGNVSGGVLDDLGEIYFELGQDSLAMDYFRRSLPDIIANGPDLSNECEIYLGMAKLF